MGSNEKQWWADDDYPHKNTLTCIYIEFSPFQCYMKYNRGLLYQNYNGGFMQESYGGYSKILWGRGILKNLMGVLRNQYKCEMLFLDHAMLFIDHVMTSSLFFLCIHLKYACHWPRYWFIDLKVRMSWKMDTKCIQMDTKCINMDT